MSQEVVRVDALANGALDAAAAFHGVWAARARATIGRGCRSLVIVMEPAAYDHADWRRAAAHDLAREATPARVNIVASDDESAIAATLAFLERSPGVTGHYLLLDGQGAGNAAD